MHIQTGAEAGFEKSKRQRQYRARTAPKELRSYRLIAAESANRTEQLSRLLASATDGAKREERRAGPKPAGAELEADDLEVMRQDAKAGLQTSPRSRSRIGFRKRSALLRRLWGSAARTQVVALKGQRRVRPYAPAAPDHTCILRYGLNMSSRAERATRRRGISGLARSELRGR